MIKFIFYNIFKKLTAILGLDFKQYVRDTSGVCPSYLKGLNTDLTDLTGLHRFSTCFANWIDGFLRICPSKFEKHSRWMENCVKSDEIYVSKLSVSNPFLFRKKNQC